MKPKETEDIKKQAAKCLKMMLSGQVSYDHMMDEFGTSNDPEINEIIKIIEEETRETGRYTKTGAQSGEFKKTLEALIKKLEPA